PASVAAKGMFKATEAGKVGTAMHLLLADPAAMTELLSAAGAMAPGAPAVARSIPLKNNGGSVALEAAPIRDESGRATGFVILVGDR
ncbi:MAG TPA: hypothetical protein PLE25_01005, partial [Spirochaetales bacterium]|nr:hypothetical protein [Spirochaetales bacterium]